MPRKSNPKLVMRTKKIFVGGLSATTSLEDIKAYFEQFSKVTGLFYFHISPDLFLCLIIWLKSSRLD